MGEFIFVLENHFKEISWKSFLINHSLAYNIAFITCLLEYFIEIYIFEFEFKVIL